MWKFSIYQEVLRIVHWFAQPLRQSTESWGPGEFITGAMCLVGISIFAVWLVVKNGVRTLADCPRRHNHMPFGVPFVLIGVWILLTQMSVKLAELVMSETAIGWQGDFAVYLAMMIVDTLMIIAALVIAQMYFVGGVVGLGLNPRTIIRDLFMGAINLLAAYPLILVAVAIVMYLGKWFAGPQFHWQSNEGLVAITKPDNAVLPLQVLLLFYTVIVVPIFEETIFRGMLQTMIHTAMHRPWAAIVITSLLFSVLHPSTHIPALFVLSCCMGYAYEKSGSLFRSIFIHSLFNGLNIIAALNS